MIFPGTRTVTMTGAALLIAGCVPIPIADPPPFNETVISGLDPGSPRADVLFTLGAPHFVHAGERVFVYSGVEAKMLYFIVLGAGTGGGTADGAVAKQFLFVIEFDEAGDILRSEVLDLGLLISVGGATDEHRGIICTSWDLCLRDGGTVMLPRPVTGVGGQPPNDPLF